MKPSRGPTCGEGRGGGGGVRGGAGAGWGGVGGVPRGCAWGGTLTTTPPRLHLTISYSLTSPERLRARASCQPWSRETSGSAGAATAASAASGAGAAGVASASARATWRFRREERDGRAAGRAPRAAREADAWACGGRRGAGAVGGGARGGGSPSPCAPTSRPGGAHAGVEGTEGGQGDVSRRNGPSSGSSPPRIQDEGRGDAFRAGPRVQGAGGGGPGPLPGGPEGAGDGGRRRNRGRLSHVRGVRGDCRRVDSVLGPQSG